MTSPSREAFHRLWRESWQLHDVLAAALSGPLFAAELGIDLHSDSAELRLLRDRAAALSDAFECLHAVERGV
jgi:hypothetical protein